MKKKTEEEEHPFPEIMTPAFVSINTISLRTFTWVSFCRRLK